MNVNMNIKLNMKVNVSEKVRRHVAVMVVIMGVMVLGVRVTATDCDTATSCGACLPVNNSDCMWCKGMASTDGYCAPSLAEGCPSPAFTTFVLS